MGIVDALKTIYGNSEFRIVYADKELNVLWRNHEDLPEILIADNLKLNNRGEIALPLTETAVCRYDDGNATLTMRISPLSEDGTAAGYLIHCLDEYEVDKLAMQSVLKERIRKNLEAVRYEAGSLFNLLNLQKKARTANGDPSDFELESRRRILGIMSSISNYEEVSIYLGDSIGGECKFMSAALDDLAKRIQIRADMAGYTFECDVRSMVYMQMNTDRFEAAVANLAANAYMYNSKPEKECRIELFSAEGKIQLTVTDNGDGIPEDKLAKLQRPFEYFSSDDLNESLGLTVAMLYCQRFGGRLEIESEVGKYTRVKMIFEDPGRDIPRDFRQYFPPMTFALDNTGCILGKCFGYFDDNSYKM